MRVEGGLHYRGTFRVETYAPSEYRDAATRILARDPFERIKAFFDDDGASDIPPFALFDYRRRPRCLDALCVHAYPHERTIVFVETRVDVAPE